MITLILQRPMKFCMSRFAFKQLQVFNSIILFIFNRAYGIFNSFMVNNLRGQKVASEFLLHNKTSSSNITSFLSKRMIRPIKKNISTVNFFTAFPMPFISLCYNTQLFSCCFRWLISFLKLFARFISFFKPTSLIYSFLKRTILFHLFKMLFASFIDSFWHINLQLKKPAFDVLIRMRLNILHLLTGLNLHKNTATLLDDISISHFSLNTRKGL